MRISIATLAGFAGYFFFFCLIKFLIFLFADLIHLNGSVNLWNVILNHRHRKVFVHPSKVTPVLSVNCYDKRTFDALLIVHSKAERFVRRHEYRRTYGNYNFTQPRRIKVVFLLGQPSDPEDQSLILKEHYLFQDIVQGAFTDTYRNLTWKHVMGLRWMTEVCDDLDVVIKMDDDVIFDVNRFFEEEWPLPIYGRNIIQCHLYDAGGPVERRGKWHVSPDRYPSKSYPPYCSGFLVVIPYHLVRELYVTTINQPYIPVDDAFVYGIARQRSKVIQVGHFDRFAVFPDDFKRCVATFGDRCKYVGAQLKPGESFITAIFKLVDRKPYLGE